jgi:hypothetical protein
VDGFESFGLGFCSKWKLECKVGFRAVDGTADAAEVDDFAYIVVHENVLELVPNILH